MRFDTCVPCDIILSIIMIAVIAITITATGVHDVTIQIIRTTGCVFVANVIALSNYFVNDSLNKKIESNKNIETVLSS